ncbi:MAG: RidA family protein [Pseudomonadota bacterium]
MAEITRHHTTARMSQIVLHGETICLAGQVGTAGASVSVQTEEILAKLDTLLTEAGSSRKHILQAVIWVADMSDYAEMNTIWDAWIPSGAAPARACGEAKLARPDLAIEIIATAAII